ncbi:MAG: ribonuclease P protein component [Caldimonas sp.]
MARIVKSVDFERVLRVRSRASTAHFAVHHLAGAPVTSGTRDGKLSTISDDSGGVPVDDCAPEGATAGFSWVGAVVPKRHARRAVTRSLLKRQIYAAAERHRAHLAPGLWIVRLRSPFDRARFTSAASEPLRRGARDELEALLEAARAGAGA